jgi:putative thioredoxin
MVIGSIGPQASADYQARFDLALGLNAKGQQQEAVDQLIEIVRRDRF